MNSGAISTINTQYMTIPTIVSPVKMEYGWNFSISGLKMMVKSGLEKIFLKFIHAPAIFYYMNLPHRKEEFWSKVQKWQGERMEEFPKKHLAAYLHMINEALSHKFHPYSILTGQVSVKWLTY